MVGKGLIIVSRWVNSDLTSILFCLHDLLTVRGFYFAQPDKTNPDIGMGLPLYLQDLVHVGGPSLAAVLVVVGEAPVSHQETQRLEGRGGTVSVITANGHLMPHTYHRQ